MKNLKRTLKIEFKGPHTSFLRKKARPWVAHSNEAKIRADDEGYACVVYEEALKAMGAASNEEGRFFYEEDGKYLGVSQEFLAEQKKFRFNIDDYTISDPGFMRQWFDSLDESHPYIEYKDFCFALEVARTYKRYCLFKKYKKLIPNGSDREFKEWEKLREMCKGKIGVNVGSREMFNQKNQSHE